MLDVAGRESAPSPEQSLTVLVNHAINVSWVTGIYFPTSCNVYFGTAPGVEPNHFNSTTITNGTCTFTLTTTAGQTAGAPQAVGNAMRTWLTEENNGSSCLFCGFGGGIGTGFLGLNLTGAQYGAPPRGGEFYLGGGVAATGSHQAGAACSASGSTATGGICAVEATSTGWTPTAGQDYQRADSTAHAFKCSFNGAAETACGGSNTGLPYGAGAGAVNVMTVTTTP